MNNYLDLTTLKSTSFLNITGTGDDVYLRILGQTASRSIDNYTKRHFYTKSETRYFDGAGRILLIDDLLTITTLKTDEDADGTFEETYTANQDYELYPLNVYPKMSVEISSRTDREYSDFNDGVKKGVQIIGLWGYGDGESATPYIDSGTTTNEELDASETGVDVVLGSALSIGQTILAESEQMYVTGISSNTMTVKRGVNGTTAATHVTGKSVYIYQYPDLIKQACLIQTMRWWKRKDSAFANVIGNVELGTTEFYKSLDPDVRFILGQYEKKVV